MARRTAESARRSARKQPHRLPPPLLEGGEPLQGEAILREFLPELGLVLWKTARSLYLLTGAPEHVRTDLFSAGAYERRLLLIENAVSDPELTGHLKASAQPLTGVCDVGALEIACAQLAHWASGRQATGTALEFFQLAALLQPLEGSYAREAGKLARMRGDFPRAEMWFRHGLSRARNAADWRIATWSMVGLGIVARLRGNLRGAESWFGRAIRRARRHSITEVVAAAFHELTVVAIRRSSNRLAARYGRLALEHYSADDPRFPALAHDLAVFWMGRGYHEEALSVFTSIPGGFGGAPDRLARQVNIAKAAGHLQLDTIYERAWEAAQPLLRDEAAAQMWPTALAGLAAAASAMGDTERAREAAERALELSEIRGETQVRHEAELLLEQLITATPQVEEEKRRGVPAPVTTLANDLVAALA